MAKRKLEPAREAIEAAVQLLKGHPAGELLNLGSVCADPCCERAPRHGWAVVDSNGAIHANLWRRGTTPPEWAWVLAHAHLHLGFGHLPSVRGERPQPDTATSAARCAVVNRFLASLKIGEPPFDLPDAYPDGEEDTLAVRWRRDGVPPEHAATGLAGEESDQLLVEHHGWQLRDWVAEFARGLSRAAAAAIDVAGGLRAHDGARRRGPWEVALGWFVSSYPLLGAIAAGMTLVADLELARTHSISIAAVDASAGEIYINPHAVLSEPEWRFVLAHEMLHAALRHADRVGGRDPYLWNVAADYVINGWLVEMRVGEMPESALYDLELAGRSAEEVYDRIAKDLRRLRKLATLRGRGLGDILSEPLGRPGAATSLDDFYRRALLTGLAYHRTQRGDLPAGLEQEIRALEQPPMPWDAQLARWFDEYVRSPEPVRSYARASRRQSSSPDIPRPGRYVPEDAVQRCTFGVVLDTSGSMSTTMLGKALGAIAAYALARDVPAARVVFCDAAPYDAGYLPVEQIAGPVRVRGRGGTVLQPAISFLQRAEDFPADAPLLIITDGFCDRLTVRREHAYLVPAGASLPFTPRGPVFRVR